MLFSVKNVLLGQKPFVKSIKRDKNITSFALHLLWAFILLISLCFNVRGRGEKAWKGAELIDGDMEVTFIKKCS